MLPFDTCRMKGNLKAGCGIARGQREAGSWRYVGIIVCLFVCLFVFVVRETGWKTIKIRLTT